MTISPFSLAEDLLLMNAETSLPRDLPGHYGRVVADLEKLLQATETLAVVAGGWAVWRHGYAGRVTGNVDVVVPQDRMDQVQRVAGLCGFDYLEPPEGRWPKLLHRDTKIEVDLLPELGIPGTAGRRAPVAIGHPKRYGATLEPLRYITLAGLVELKLGAGRVKDIADVIELINAHRDQVSTLRDHLANLNATYAGRFDELVRQAEEERSV